MGRIALVKPKVPSYPAGNREHGKTLINRTSFRDTGNLARDRRDWPEAVDAYRKHLARKPDDVAIWVQFGHSLKETGDLTGAETAYAKAVALAPDDWDGYLQIGHVYKAQGLREHALGAFRRAAGLGLDSADLRREIEHLAHAGVASSEASGLVWPPHEEDVRALIATAEAAEARTANHVCIVGKFGTGNGIAMHSHAFLQALKRQRYQVECIDTRPAHSEAEYKSNAQVDFIDPDLARPAFVSIFTDVIANSYDDANTSKLPLSFIKIAYAVFDASLVPTFWVARLNRFDAIAVPDEWVRGVLARSGVIRPIFVLPLAIDYTTLAHASASRNNDAFTFGCVAGFSSRKNLLSLIQTFHDTFGNNPSVRLHIHGALNFSHGFERMLEEVEKRGITNVVLTSQELSEARYAQLLRSFDVYVNVSKGEGFSITPRQAMYLGIPTILSDNTAHQTIVNSGLVKGIPTASYERAHFEGIDGIDCGYQCIPSTSVLKQALMDAWREGSHDSSRALHAKEFAEKYSLDALIPFYETLVWPKDVFLGTSDRLLKNRVETSDPSLYEKYRAARQHRKASVPKSQQQVLSVVGHDGGFFSVFNSFLSHLVWNIGRSEVTAIVPDWRVDSIAVQRGLQKFTSFCYGQRSDGNLWLKFFHPIPNQTVSVSAYNDESFLGKSIKMMDLNEKNEPNLTYIHAYKLYKDKHFAEWRRWYNDFYREYIHVRETISSEVDTFVANNFDAEFIVGCHVRHPSHGIEQPGANMPTVELFQQHVIRRTAGLRNWKVFLATDQDSVVKAFAAVFGDRLICRSDVARVTASDDSKFKSLSTDEQNREGHQIQHLKAADESSWSLDMGNEVIIDALLLAKCQTFIHVTSNIATAVSFMNPDIEMIYCE